jgi:hypothetical protein
MTTLSNLQEFLDYYNRRSRFYNEEIKRSQKLIELYQIRMRLYDIAITQSVQLIQDKYKIIKKLNDKIENIEFLTCKICMETISECIIRPCLHFCCCLDCMDKLIQRRCPMCREPFENYYRIYY